MTEGYVTDINQNEMIIIIPKFNIEIVNNYNL